MRDPNTCRRLAHPRLTCLHQACNTFPGDLLISSLPFETHSLEQFFGVLKLDLLAPGDDVDQSQDGIIEIVNLEGVVGDGSFKIFGVVNEIDDAVEERDIDGEGSGEEQQPSRCYHCCQFEHD